MNRRSFLGVIATVAAFPWSALKRAAGYVNGWRILRQRVGAFDCSARYRWMDDETVQVDWMKATAKKAVVGSDAPFPRLTLSLEDGPARLEWKESL